jgi:hypothetical protein
MVAMKVFSWARALPLRVQVTAIGLGYLGVLAYGVAVEFMRHLAELRDPAASSGGMWAFGDELLAWYIFLLFMVPTIFLLLLLRQHEQAYITYSKILFWFSLTAPLCLGILVLAALAHAQAAADPLAWRPWRAPFVVVVMGMSRVFARFAPAKRLLTRALLIEVGTLAIFIALMMSPGR